MTLTDGQIATIARYFQPRPVRSVYLFGSRARSDGGPLADVDLILEMDMSGRQHVDLRTVKRDLHRLLGLPVDAYAEHQVLKYARPHIWTERVLIYRRVRSRGS